MEITATQDFDTWFDDYVAAAIADEPASLPPAEQKIGATTVRWFETDPGIAHISVEGGTIDDRLLAQMVVQEQLRPQGFKRAAYSLNWNRHDANLMRESAWPDIEAKAKRLIQSEKVHILRNGANVVVAQVEGDHGNYQSEFNRDDPNSESISLWQCECPWDQFAWQRTRQWKKYEGRVCAHVLATYWKSKSTPLDEEYEPGQSPNAPNPEAPGGAAPMVQPTPSFQPTMAPGQIAPGSQAPMPPGQAAPPPELLPEFPADPALMPAINPVSVPGQKPQTPLNPVQNPGGTFSSVQADSLSRMSAEGFVNGAMVVNKNEEWGTAVGLNGGEQVAIPKNSQGEVLGVDPLGLVNVYFAGPMSESGNLQPHGVQAWFWPADLVARSDIKPPGPAIRRH